MKLPEQVWSRDNECFHDYSLRDVLDDCRVKVGSTIYVGDKAELDVGGFCDSDDVLDILADRACDEVGDYADGFTDVTPDAVAELNALLRNWIEKHCESNFFTVKNIRTYRVAAQDFKDYFGDQP